MLFSKKLKKKKENAVDHAFTNLCHFIKDNSISRNEVCTRESATNDPTVRGYSRFRSKENSIFRSRAREAKVNSSIIEFPNEPHFRFRRDLFMIEIVVWTVC